MPSENTAFVPPVMNALDLATVLHELGHADQYSDPALKHITIEKKRLPKEVVPSVEEVRKAIRDFSGLEEKIQEEDIQKLQKIEDGQHQLEEDLTARDVLDQDKAFNERVRLLNQQRRQVIRCACEKALKEIRSLQVRIKSAESMFERGPSVESARLYEQQKMEILSSAQRLFGEDVQWNMLSSVNEQMFLLMVKIEKIEGGMVDVALGRHKLRFELEAGIDSQQLASDLAELAIFDGLVKERRSYREQLINRIRDTQSVINEETEHLKERLPMIFEVNHLYVQTLERDATRRAFRWMHRISEELHIDLFQVMRVERHSTMLSEYRECDGEIIEFPEEQRAEELATDVVSDLKNALWTYGATNKRMKGSYDGKIPHPKRQKTKKTPPNTGVHSSV